MEHVKNSNLSIYNRVHDYEILLVGVGGTGSCLAEQIGRLHYALINSDLPGIRLTLLDYDTVEQKNIGRQNFYANEIGKLKTQAIAQRLSRQFLMKNITIINKKFHEHFVSRYSYDNYDVVICSVDNFSARKDVYDYFHKKSYIIDIGNEKDFGQISLSYSSILKHSFNVFGMMESKNQSDESNYNCGYAEQFDEQGLFINQTMAVYAAELLRDFLTNDTIDYNFIFVNLKNKKTTKALKNF